MPTDGAPTAQQHAQQEEILRRLREVPFATLSTLIDDSINVRSMLFANDPTLVDFYCLTDRHTDKVQELGVNPSCALGVIYAGERLDDYAEVAAMGQARVIDAAEALTHPGLGLLADKSPMVRALQQGGALGDYVLLHLQARRVVFRVYGELLQGVPKTIIEHRA